MTQTRKNEKAATGKAARGNRQKQAAAQAAPAEAAENPQASENTAQAAPAEAAENPQTLENTAQTAPAEAAEKGGTEAPQISENTEPAAAETPETAKPTETIADSPQAPKPALPAGGEKKKEADRLPAFLAPYVKAYPINKTFHVTTDQMVFLANDRGLAVMHQNSLKKGGAVETYNL